MCDTCGCGENDSFTIRKPGVDGPGEPDEAYSHSHGHDHGHDHPHDHEHPHPEPGKRILVLEKDVLTENNRYAGRNRGFFGAKRITCLNLVSSPGSGKTTLLEKTIGALKEKYPVCVVEGDQQSMLDAERIARLGVPAVQVNTGPGCHLDAMMVNKSLGSFNFRDHTVLFIENVGNLVCPALFDLGEAARVLVMSVTEGEDKPLKYPAMFRSSHLCLINKTDLLPYVDFNVENARNNALSVNPSLEFIEISARTGEGVDKWLDWITGQITRTK